MYPRPGVCPAAAAVCMSCRAVCKPPTPLPSPLGPPAAPAQTPYPCPATVDGKACPGNITVTREKLPVNKKKIKVCWVVRLRRGVGGGSAPCAMGGAAPTYCRWHTQERPPATRGPPWPSFTRNPAFPSCPGTMAVLAARPSPPPGASQRIEAVVAAPAKPQPKPQPQPQAAVLSPVSKAPKPKEAVADAAPGLRAGKLQPGCAYACAHATLLFARRLLFIHLFVRACMRSGQQLRGRHAARVG